MALLRPLLFFPVLVTVLVTVLAMVPVSAHAHYMGRTIPIVHPNGQAAVLAGLGHYEKSVRKNLGSGKFNIKSRSGQAGQAVKIR